MPSEHQPWDFRIRDLYQMSRSAKDQENITFNQLRFADEAVII
jgi:hypothetical protein